MEFVKNALGRKIPTELEGRKLRPYEGKLAEPIYTTLSRKIRMSKGKSKLVGSLEEAIKKTGLKNGMTVSFHHCLREGDEVMTMVMDTIAKMGFKDMMFASTAVFPHQKSLIEHIRSGVISRIEGSMNGPIGEEASKGSLAAPAVLRSHGGRGRAIETGELKIDQLDFHLQTHGTQTKLLLSPTIWFHTPRFQSVYRNLMSIM